MRFPEKRSKLLKSAVIFLAAGLLVFLAFLSTSYFDTFNRYGRLITVRAAIFSKFSHISSFIGQIRTLGRLVKENEALKEERTALLSRLSAYLELEEQNQFLREALGLDQGSQRKLVEARTFNVQFTPEGYELNLNKGSEDGLSEGDIVVSPQGVLIGQIIKIESNFSKANLVNDPDFKTTVKLLGKNTTGISRGLLGKGILLDFISQNDDVVIGDTVVTSGNDLLPAGLIVGTINEIGSDDGDLFQEIIAKPKLEEINIDRVLILSN